MVAAKAGECSLGFVEPLLDGLLHSGTPLFVNTNPYGSLSVKPKDCMQLRRIFRIISAYSSSSAQTRLSLAIRGLA